MWRGEARFACDAMLGRLARWLRALSYDTVYDPEIEDEDLVRRAVRDGRFLLTRDRRLPEEWRIDGCLVLESDVPLDQLREVDDRLDLEWPRPLFRRCL
ncbi:MAG: twitching motility protein PilT, partial [Gammaproteobacteria bacterium]|nr:twitching motility protein PilT [Gemmatimonadota bacterium]NIU77242.1 twitching motility protein PilT [Gammaproteobacteria bacterium]